MTKFITSKDPEEAYAIEFDFSSVLSSISTAECSASDSAILNGAPQISGTSVRQRVYQGESGVDYPIRCKASDGIETYVLVATLPVRTAT